MKNWERKLREQQDMTLTKRFAYAAAGFLSSGLLSPLVLLVLFYVNVRLLDMMHLWIAPAATTVFVATFTLAGFLAGDKMVDWLSQIWEDLFGV